MGHRRALHLHQLGAERTKQPIAPKREFRPVLYPGPLDSKMERHPQPRSNLHPGLFRRVRTTPDRDPASPGHRPRLRNPARAVHRVHIADPSQALTRRAPPQLEVTICDFKISASSLLRATRQKSLLVARRAKRRAWPANRLGDRVARADRPRPRPPLL